MAKISKQNRSLIVGIKNSIRTAMSQFKGVGGLGMRNSEKLVEARAGLIRAERKLNKILKEVDY